jgi:hypothetical protein
MLFSIISSSIWVDKNSHLASGTCNKQAERVREKGRSGREIVTETERKGGRKRVY